MAKKTNSKQGGKIPAAKARKSKMEPSEEPDIAEKVIPSEILERMPEPMKEKISQSLSIMQAGPMMNPLSAKVTSDHIDKIIDKDSEENKQQFELEKSARRYNFAYVVLAIATFFAIALMFAKDSPDLFKAMISHMSAILAGFGAGWGFTKAKAGKTEK